MKNIFVALAFLLVTSTSYGQQCNSLFTIVRPINKNHELLNSLKRIRNYGTFSSFILMDSKNNKMNLVIFDKYKDGVIETRPSLEDFIQELRSFASEVRFIYNEQSQDQILVSMLANTLVKQVVGTFHYHQNQRKQEVALFESVLEWLDKPGKHLNVIVLPEAHKESFTELSKTEESLVVLSFDSVIRQMDPL